MINAIPTGHVCAIRADLGWVDACPRIDIDVRHALKWFFIISQVVITKGDHIRLVAGAVNEAVDKDHFSGVRAIGMHIVDGKAMSVHFDLGFGCADLICIAEGEDQAGVLKRIL